MREILFRGKCKETGEWYTGHYIHLHKTTYCFKEDYDRDKDNDIHQIVFEKMMDWGLPNQHLRVDVIPETVGQYTGINIGVKKLFEGDIVEWHEDYDDTWGYPQTTIGRSVVVWDKENFCWSFETDGYIQAFNDWNWNSSFIIGNIHDNPELLKEREGK